MVPYSLPIVTVFDLDDTLYKERDYVHSGMVAVWNFGQSLGLIPLFDTLESLGLDGGNGDFLGAICAHYGLPDTTKNALLWHYRLHLPAIELHQVARQALDDALAGSKVVAVLTDGRSVTQRLKLKALGLADLPVFISEEYEAGKPSPVMFKKIEMRWPGCVYVYIGDNVTKDFIAPNELGWLTIGLRDDGRNVHSQSWVQKSSNSPRYWIESLDGIRDIVATAFPEQGSH